VIVSASDGVRLFTVANKAKRRKGSLLVFHGIGEHCGRYQKVFEQAADLGLSSFAMDLRGHGRSQGVRGHIASWEQLQSDVDLWIEHLVAAGSLSEELPLFFLGHSLGGLVAASAALRYRKKPTYPRLQGLTLSSPSLALRWTPLRLLELQAAQLLPPFLRTVQVPTGISAEQLTHDENERKLFASDPLVHQWITPAAFLAMESAMSETERRLKELEVPVFFLLGGEDKVIDVRRVEKLARKLQLARPGMVEVKQFQKFLHEPFHETHQDRAFQEWHRWTLKQLVALGKSSNKGAIGRVISH
jgi:alpha-beta hydrolase superfamily lysophospholipase